MMLKKSRFLVLVMALVLVIVSCTTFAAVKPIKLVYGVVFARDHFFVKADEYFKKLVEKKSKGKILIDYFPMAQLGSNPEMLQATKSGAQDMYMDIPKLLTFELPYFYRNQKHISKVADRYISLVGQDDFVAKANMHVIGVRLASARQLTTKFPVNKLGDIKGVKIRVPESGMSLALWRTLGAVPTSIPASDTYTALATGTVDAQENPFSDIYAWKFYEQVKYCAMTSHVQLIYLMLINNDRWNNLTKVQQKILTDAAVKSCKYSDTLRIAKEKEYKELLTKGGMKFTTPDLAPFREKAKTIWSQFGDEELIKKIQAIK
jgi:tripartite ATP-independent transporter DctP family solute receptor